MDNKTKNFVLNNLISTIKQVQSSIDANDHEKAEQLYEIHLKYIYKTLDIVVQEYLPTDYQLIKNEIELIDSQEKSKFDKTLEICKKLIDLGMKIIDEY